MAARWRGAVQNNKIAMKFAGMTLPKDKCTRCDKVVYATEKETSAKGALFHKQCFSCAEPGCRQKLNHNNAKTNPNADEPEIYCQGHVPKLETRSIGPDAMNMMRLKKYSDMQKKLSKRATLKAASIDINAYGIKSDMVSQAFMKDRNDNKANQDFPAVLVEAKDRYQQDLIGRQEELERLQKEEEDTLFKKFEAERRQAVCEMQTELDVEWESKIKDLIAMFDRKEISKEQFEKLKQDARKQFEGRRAQRMKNQKQQLLHKQQQETSKLVEKQGDEMLKLIKVEKERLARDVQAHIEDAQADNGGDNNGWLGEENLNIEEVVTDIIGTTEAPPPRQPKSRKSDIMPDDEDNEFNKLFDEHVATVAENDQTTFTELVNILTGPFIDDLSKARAIYRWITYKDLNKIQFNGSAEDSPMGLMRGIKYGTETYHTLFKRLCSYAGLHCVEVNGKSKSVGYEPGMQFTGNSFRNTWNAVLIDGEWRLVQCNWGARFLVINKDKSGADKKQPDPKSSSSAKKDDSIKYQYDEHYFLTDAEDFIQEFFPNKSEWQLLEHPITQHEFENLPLVRSIFFHLGLKFKKRYPAVLDASKTGGTDIRIIVPPEIAAETAFLYQLRFSEPAKASETEFCGSKLDRYVYQSMHENEVAYSVHVPTNGEYFLQIFASKMESKPGEIVSMEGVKLKCVCKLKIICNGMKEKIFPLPNCAPGEWGPKKAQRQFMMNPVSHSKGVVTAENNLKVKFTLGMPLVFLAKLKMNDVDDKFFQDFIDAQYDDEHLRVKVGFPVEGQYGLDIYAKPKQAPAEQPLAHACKYLINVTSVQHPVEFGLAKVENALSACMSCWGPQSSLEELGMSTISHPNWKIKTESSQVVVRLQALPQVVVSAHLIREPDEDWKEHLLVQREGEDVSRLVIHSLTKPGNYMLIVFARLDDDDSTVYNNVFNYLIKSTIGIKQGQTLA